MLATIYASTFRANAFGNCLPAGPYDAHSLARQGSTPDHRTASLRLLPDGENLSGHERSAASLRERSCPPTLVRGRSAHVLRKGAIRPHSNWDFQMRLPCLHLLLQSRYESTGQGMIKIRGAGNPLRLKKAAAYTGRRAVLVMALSAGLPAIMTAYFGL